MEPDIHFLQEALQKREKENKLRQLNPEAQLIDLSSNDYLGFARNEKLNQETYKEIEAMGFHLSGSTGSRLLTGNTAYAEKLEKKIAAFHNANAALLFNSGYDANLGLLSSIAQRSDTFIYDSLSHASIIDGIRLSRAERKYKFAHNDIADLKKKIKHATGKIFIVVESLYSMDGDFAPLPELINVCKQYGAYLIVDEAHSTGLFGSDGKGLVVAEKSESDVFARVFTFGKALGAHGAAIAGTQALKDYLINFSRSFIYTTALPFHALASVNIAYNYLPEANAERKRLFENISFFREKIKQSGLSIEPSQSPIQSILARGNDEVKQTALLLQNKGFDIRPIVSPTVEKGKERLRICIHSYNTTEQLKEVITILNEAQ
ncbi:MAG TPA: pyridoxal phosphate-dependent aminotransferase family protein [Chitinophagaceae bacterium]|nr:pyridoxal phosphate-dependent aminotransferase family protein [Chitinophagaceae bacterium]